MARVMVTGGAGYVGSHIVRRLREDGHSTVVLDDLSTGHRESVAGVELVEGDIGDAAVVEPVLAAGVEYVIHMAASAPFSIVGCIPRMTATSARVFPASDSSQLQSARETFLGSPPPRSSRMISADSALIRARVSASARRSRILGSTSGDGSPRVLGRPELIMSSSRSGSSRCR